MPKQWTSLQQKAVGWYASENDLRLTLSAWPVIYFSDKQTNKEVHINIFDLVEHFEAARKEQRKEAARAKRLAAKK